MVCAVWGKATKGHRVECWTDNVAVVGIVNSARKQSKLAMHLVRCLISLLHSSLSDSNSSRTFTRLGEWGCRFPVLSLFRLQVPSVSSTPTRIPQELLDMLIQKCPDWTSQSWSNQFRASYFTKGLASSTVQTYKSGQEKYLRCSARQQH